MSVNMCLGMVGRGAQESQRQVYSEKLADGPNSLWWQALASSEIYSQLKISHICNLK